MTKRTRSKRWWHGTCGAMLLLFTAWGCAGPSMPEGAQKLGRQSQALNGNLMTIDCHATQRAQLQAAMDALKKAVITTPFAFQQCLRQALFANPFDIDGDYVFAESAYQRLAEPLPTTIKCKELPVGNGWIITGIGSIGISNEELKINIHYLAKNPTTAKLASVILHEIGHNKGFNHFGGVEASLSMNEQVEKCVKDIIELSSTPNQPTIGGASVRPHGTVLSAHTKEVSLPPMGGRPTGSQPFWLWCGQDQIAVAQRMRDNGSSGASSRIMGIELACQPMNASTTSYSYRRVGNTTATPLESCGTGRVLIGVEGEASTEGVHRLRMLCGDRADVLNQVVAVTKQLSYRGSPHGVRVQRLCPPGMVMRGLRGDAVLGTTTPSISQLRPVCVPLRTPSAPAQDIGFLSTSTMMESHTNTDDPDKRRELFLCQNQGAVTSFYGQTLCLAVDEESTKHCRYAVRLGGQCQQIQQDQPQGPLFETEGIGHSRVRKRATLVHESLRSTVSSCPPGEAMVGMRVGFDASHQITFLQGRCMPPSLWKTASPSLSLPLLWTPRMGCVEPADCATVHTTVRNCPRGSLLAGIWLTSVLSTSSIVRRLRRLRLICRHFDTTSWSSHGETIHPWQRPNFTGDAQGLWVSH